MPKPNLLPPVDWRALFDAAPEFDAWLARGEKADNQEKMRNLRGETTLGDIVEDALKSLEEAVHVLAMAEDWCGDVVRHVPILQRMADASPMLRVRYVSRKTSPELLARFLTNGTESVPKFGFFSKDFALCGLWGPMPEACCDVIRVGRARQDPKSARQQVRELYDADPDREVVVDELLHRVLIASGAVPGSDSEEQPGN
jgi:hypothetical protein